MNDKQGDEILYCSDEAFDEQKIAERYEILKNHGSESPILANRFARSIYLLDNSPLGVFVTDLKGMIRWTNQQAQNITGYTLDELKGNNMRILQSGHQDRDFYVAMWKQILEKGYWQGEVWNRKKNGSVHYQWMRLSAMRDHNGNVNEYVSIVADLSDQRFFKGQRLYQAFSDILTGLGSKQQLQRDASFLLSNHPDQKHYLILLNIHKFSDINVRYGFKTGDLLLKEAGARMKELLGEYGQLYRFSGDLFAILVPNILTTEQFAEIGKKIDSGFDQPFLIDDHDIKITTNVGVSNYPHDGLTYDNLLQNAEIALRYAKRSDTPRIQYSSEALNRETLKWMELDEDLRNAIENDELHMVYQIMVDNRSKKVKGSEALIRWNHPTKGFIPPDVFIPYAESSELIVPLGYWIIESVFQDAAMFHKNNNTLHYFSINLSAKQIEEEEFVECIAHLMDQYKIEPGQIVFEITERVASHNPEHVTKVFQALKALGFKISLDDFGKGESSLSFLMNFDVDILKVDASFITNIGQDEQKHKMTKAIFNFCSEISVETVAEGVETIDDVLFLAAQNCDTLQGYYFSKPLPYDEFEKFSSQNIFD